MELGEHGLEYPVDDGRPVVTTNDSRLILVYAI